MGSLLIALHVCDARLAVMRSTSRTLTHAALLAAIALAASLAVPTPAHAQSQIRRCTAPNGTVIFTDKSCEDAGGSERRPQTGVAGSLGSKSTIRGCPRSLRDLVFEVSSAIDARDANRLAGVYHWAGMSGRGSVGILDRLDAIAQRPLVQITPVMPAPRVRLDAGSGLTVSGNLDPSRIAAAPVESAADGQPSVSPDDADYYPQARVQRTPVGLRVDQTIGSTMSASRTVFGLRRNMGCWFIQL